MRRFELVVPMLAGLALTACPEKGPSDPEPDELEITTSTLPSAAVGEAYSAGVDATGGDGEYSWDLAAGSLPPGLDLSVEDLTDDDVLITGLPEQPGTFDFVLRVNSDDGQADTRQFSITVIGDPTAVSIETSVLPPALAGASYRTALVASGGTGSYTWSVTGGSLPPGLSFKDGATVDSIVGTPTVPDTSIVVLHVQSGAFEAEAALTIQVVANRAGTFDITLAPVVPVPGTLQPFLDAAVARWQDVITGDVPQAAITGGFFQPGQCGGFGPILNGTSADDIIILINIAPIDGPGQVLGQATPCVIRGPSLNRIPFGGVLTLDSEDLENVSGTPAAVAEFVQKLMLHEIGHVLGFGSLWELADLKTTSTTDPRFTGAQAIGEWQALGGTGQVPIENTGGQGTAGSHWRESVFGNEVMTGFAEQIGTFQPLSRVTIASLEDFGYTVDYTAADAFVLPVAPGAPGRAPEAPNYGYDIVPIIDIYQVDETGRRTIFRRRAE